jgi:PAS domain-containing protein
VLPTEPLPLYHSWALADAPQRLDLGYLADDDAGDGARRAAPMLRADPTRGWWRCDLAGDRLDWSPPVRRLFGLNDPAIPDRAAVVSLYAERSRAAMERLRAHAIRHRRGFTLDVEIRAMDAATRWIRLSAAPVCDDARTVVALHGIKSDVSHLYRLR